MAYSDLSGIFDPVDESFRDDFLNQLSQLGGGRFTDAQLADAIQRASWYGRLGSGSNPYNAAYEVMSGLNSGLDYNPAAAEVWRGIAENRSPEGIARANDGGFLDSLGPLGNIAQLGLGSAGLGVGGLSGASAATGNGITPQTLALDAAGLAAGAGLSGAMAGSAAGGGTAAGTGSGAVGAGGEETGGGGMWDWLDSIDGGGDTFTVNPSISDLGGNIDPVTGFPIDAGGSAAAGGSSIWDTLVNKGLGYAQNYLTNKLNGGSGSGNVLDMITNNPLQAGINFTPFLLSAYLANQQRGDLDNVLNQINPDAYQRSVLNPYDLQTSQARAALQNDMGLRGVAGSSFGNQQLNNFDYMHGIERGDLASKAALASAGLQGQLINQRNLNSNLLLGSGLNATAKLFQPPQQVITLPGGATLPAPQPAPAPKVGDNLLGDLFNLGKSALGSGGYFGGLFG